MKQSDDDYVRSKMDSSTALSTPQGEIEELMMQVCTQTPYFLTDFLAHRVRVLHCTCLCTLHADLPLAGRRRAPTGPG
jgi:hypothetical protein